MDYDADTDDDKPLMVRVEQRGLATHIDSTVDVSETPFDGQGPLCWAGVDSVKVTYKDGSWTTWRREGW